MYVYYFAQVYAVRPGLIWSVLVNKVYRVKSLYFVSCLALFPAGALLSVDKPVS